MTRKQVITVFKEEDGCASGSARQQEVQPAGPGARGMCFARSLCASRGQPSPAARCRAGAASRTSGRGLGQWLTRCVFTELSFPLTLFR